MARGLADVSSAIRADCGPEIDHSKVNPGGPVDPEPSSSRGSSVKHEYGPPALAIRGGSGSAISCRAFARLKNQDCTFAAASGLVVLATVTRHACRLWQVSVANIERLNSRTANEARP